MIISRILQFLINHVIRESFTLITPNISLGVDCTNCSFMLCAYIYTQMYDRNTNVKLILCGAIGPILYLLKEVPHFTHYTSLLHGVEEAAMAVGEEIVSENWSVSQSLDYAVHETSVS